jgi:hypothetical protein
LTQDLFDGAFFSWSGLDESKAKCVERPPDDRGSIDRDGLGIDTALEEQAIVETDEEREFALDFASGEREIEKNGIAVINVGLGRSICE